MAGITKNEKPSVCLPEMQQRPAVILFATVFPKMEKREEPGTESSIQSTLERCGVRRENMKTPSKTICTCIVENLRLANIWVSRAYSEGEGLEKCRGVKG